MLKTCWECLMGGQRDDAGYGPNQINLNGYNSAVRPRSTNMTYFRLPKPPNPDDIITIFGPKLEQGQFVNISLTEGIQEPDTNNVPFYMKLDTQSTIEVGTIYQGNLTPKETQAASNFIEGKVDKNGKEAAFELKLTFGANIVHPILYNDSFEGVQFDHNIENITFLVIEDLKVTKLTFNYA